MTQPDPPNPFRPSALRRLSLGLLLAGLPTLVRAGFPGVNGEIAYTRCSPGQAKGGHPFIEIYTMNPQAAEGAREEHRITATPAFAPGTPGQSLFPNYSPDGLWLAYASTDHVPYQAEPSLELHVVHGNGQEPRRLTRTQMAAQVHGTASHPGWMADGRRLLHIAGAIREGSPLELRLLDDAGEHTLFSGVELSRPVCSPDGSRVAFTRHGQLWILATASGQALEFTHAGPTGYPQRCDPAFSPDGTRLAFTQQDRPGAQHRLWLVHADGSQPQALTAAGAYDCAEPDWSPDGRLLAYACTRSGDWEIYTREPVADGTQADGSPAPARDRRLTHSAVGVSCVSPSWRALAPGHPLAAMPNTP